MSDVTRAGLEYDVQASLAHASCDLRVLASRYGGEYGVLLKAIENTIVDLTLVGVGRDVKGS